jgi:hypothetical protein
VVGVEFEFAEFAEKRRGTLERRQSTHLTMPTMLPATCWSRCRNALPGEAGTAGWDVHSLTIASARPRRLLALVGLSTDSGRITRARLSHGSIVPAGGKGLPLGKHE